MTEYDWDDILEKLSRVEDIIDLVVLGQDGGVRRIIVEEYDEETY